MRLDGGRLEKSLGGKDAKLIEEVFEGAGRVCGSWRVVRLVPYMVGEVEGVGRFLMLGRLEDWRGGI